MPKGKPIKLATPYETMMSISDGYSYCGIEDTAVFDWTQETVGILFVAVIFPIYTALGDEI